jgi:hypothetical protein
MKSRGRVSEYGRRWIFAVLVSAIIAAGAAGIAALIGADLLARWIVWAVTFVVFVWAHVLWDW